MEVLLTSTLLLTAEQIRGRNESALGGTSFDVDWRFDGWTNWLLDEQLTERLATRHRWTRGVSICGARST